MSPPKIISSEIAARLASIAFNTPNVVPAYSNGFYTVTPAELECFANLVADAVRRTSVQLCMSKSANGNYSCDTRDDCAEIILDDELFRDALTV